MAATMAGFETGHTDMVHDVQYDYYGKRIATASSDRTIKVFDAAAAGADAASSPALTATLLGHEGPVWQVAWAHPKFGAVLASCSFDSKIIVWKEQADGDWAHAYDSPPTLHAASVNAVAWAPHELGLSLAAASSDGSVSVLTYKADGAWHASKLESAHAAGAMAVCWAPAAAPGALVSGGQPPPPTRKLVTAGCDSLARVWRCDPDGGWREEAVLAAHGDWVRDAQWAPNEGLPSATIATAGQDGKAYVWSQAATGGAWAPTLLRDFGVPVWKVAWSVTGSVLAVSAGADSVTLWKEGLDGAWTEIAVVQ